jgi:isopenicillin N synthase-like dioxygenase
VRPVALRPALQAYWHELDRVAQSLCRIFAEALDLAPDFFDDKVDRHISQLRIMHYPPPQVAPLPGQLRAGAHSDLGMMTLLYSDNDIGGLEVMDRAGRWVPVPLTDGAFTVNLGDLMMRWTNHRWRSTLHRVVIPPTATNDLSRRQPQVSAAARFEIARQVASACQEIGFFAVTGHGRTAAMSITGKSWLIWLTL